MSDSKTGKASEQLSEEALGAVTGGAGTPSMTSPHILSSDELESLLSGDQGGGQKPRPSTNSFAAP